MTGPVVRQATVDDCPDLAVLHQSGWGRPWPEAELRRLCQDARHLVLVVDMPGGLMLAGFVVLQWVADEAEVLTLVVDPSWRRRGLGRLMLQEASAALQRLAVISCVLEVARSNGAALGLYRPLGFEQIGLRAGYYRNGNSNEGQDGDALLMRAPVPFVSLSADKSG